MATFRRVYRRRHVALDIVADGKRHRYDRQQLQILQHKRLAFPTQDVVAAVGEHLVMPRPLPVAFLQQICSYARPFERGRQPSSGVSSGLDAPFDGIADPVRVASRRQRKTGGTEAFFKRSPAPCRLCLCDCAVEPVVRNGDGPDRRRASHLKRAFVEDSCFGVRFASVRSIVDRRAGRRFYRHSRRFLVICLRYFDHGGVEHLFRPDRRQRHIRRANRIGSPGAIDAYAVGPTLEAVFRAGKPALSRQRDFIADRPHLRLRRLARPRARRERHIDGIREFHAIDPDAVRAGIDRVVRSVLRVNPLDGVLAGRLHRYLHALPLSGVAVDPRDLLAVQFAYGVIVEKLSEIVFFARRLPAELQNSRARESRAHPRRRLVPYSAALHGRRAVERRLGLVAPPLVAAVEIEKQRRGTRLRDDVADVQDVVQNRRIARFHHVAYADAAKECRRLHRHESRDVYREAFFVVRACRRRLRPVDRVPHHRFQDFAVVCHRDGHPPALLAGERSYADRRRRHHLPRFIASRPSLAPAAVLLRRHDLYA